MLFWFLFSEICWRMAVLDWRLVFRVFTKMWPEIQTGLYLISRQLTYVRFVVGNCRAEILLKLCFNAIIFNSMIKSYVVL